jgi:uncharacterized protein YqeY
MNPLQMINDQIKSALKAGDKTKLDSLRYLMSQLQNAQINKGRNNELTQVEFQQIVKKIIKNSEEAIEQYRQGNRSDLVESESAKLDVLKELIPQPLSDEEIKSLIEQVRSQQPEIQVGPLIGQVIKLSGGRADGQTVARLAASLSQ